jgi:probable rRNA maturation factor
MRQRQVARTEPSEGSSVPRSQMARASAGRTTPSADVLVRARRAPSTASIRRWLSMLLSESRADGARVSVLLCGDSRMRRLNREWRGRNRTTDVLSFPSEPDPPRPPRRLPPDGFLGDLVISIPAATRQARRYGHGTGREVQILLAHGLLHLLGYDHEKDGGTMFRLQARLVRAAFGPGPDGVPRGMARR